jgi:hypothetical protein
VRRVLDDDVVILEVPPPLTLRLLGDGTLFAGGTDPPGFNPLERPEPVVGSTRDRGATWTAGRFPAPADYDLTALAIVP